MEHPKESRLRSRGRQTSGPQKDVSTRHGSEKQPKRTMTHVTFLPPWRHPGSRPGHQLGCHTGPRAAGRTRVCRQQTGPTSGSAATVLRPVSRSLPLRVSVSSVTKQRNGPKVVVRCHPMMATCWTSSPSPTDAPSASSVRPMGDPFFKNHGIKNN